VTRRQTSPASPKPGRFCLWAALLTAAAGAGCMTSFEGRRLHADLNQIGARLDGADQRDQMYKQQVAELDEVLKQASALLTANSNDVASKAAKAETDIAALQVLADRLAQSVAQRSQQRADELSRLDRRMAIVERRQVEIVDRVAPTLPEDKELLWKQAGARLASGQREQGRRFYRNFIERFPQDPGRRKPDSRWESHSLKKDAFQPPRPSSSGFSTLSRAHRRSRRPCISSR
jgi:hypothetical protein